VTSEKQAATFAFPVEAGKIREVADALHDDRAYFRSLDAARAAGFPAVPAPVVFTRTSWFHAPALTTVSTQIGIDPNQSRHGGQEWSIEAPLYAGQTYEVTAWRISGEETKRSRSGGTLRFVTAEREFRLQQQVVIRERTINVIIGAAIGPAAAGPEAHRAPVGAVANGPWQRDLRSFASEWRAAKSGERLAELVVGPLGLTDIVRFAGAIGDFTAIHHDPAVARRSGLADVIAMGSFPVGLALGLAEEGFGLKAIKSIRLRFHEPLYVNRVITITFDAAAETRPDAPVAKLNVRDSLGAPILSGYVSA
jgi:acyl dehydratase